MPTKSAAKYRGMAFTALLMSTFLGCSNKAPSPPATGSISRSFANQVIAGIPMMATRAEHLTRLQKMNGFQVRWRNLSSSGATGSEYLLLSAQAENLPADSLGIPQDFAEKPLGVRSGN